jgi:hypothetical protein
MAEDLAFLSATHLLALYSNKDLSPAEVMGETLRRLERYEGALNAFVLYDPEEAMTQARASEARWQKGEPEGLLDGVPVAIKDTVLTRGWPRLLGSRTIDPNQQWNEDSPVTAAAIGRRRVFRQDDDTGVRLETGHRLAAQRGYPQPMEPRTHAWWQQWRQCCCGDGRHLRARSRHRCRRLDPHSGSFLRYRWP